MSTGSGDPGQLDEWMAFAPDDDSGDDEPRRIDPFVVVGIVIGILILVAMLLSRPTGAYRTQADDLSALGLPTDFHPASVVSVTEQGCAGIETQVCEVVRFELTGGPDVGFVYSQEFPISPLTPDFGEGDHVLLSRVTPGGVIEDVGSAPCSFDTEATCAQLRLTIDDGEGGRSATYEAMPGDEAATLTVGSEVLVDFIYDGDDLIVASVRPPEPQSLYRFADFDRRFVLIVVAALFAIVVVALGGWKGVSALAGLVASLAVMLIYVLPSILDGRNPLLVAVVGSAAIAFIAMYLAHGINRRTTIALLGMIAALVLTVVLSAIVVEAARFSGFAAEETSLLTFFGSIDVGGLLLAGIVLGAAGALDDVAITQAATVWELRAANPAYRRRDLFQGAMRIGRDHIASIVNTLLLAYAGASLPLLVLFLVAGQSLGVVANSEVVAVEIVRTLVGSIGLVAAVPFTTWLAARFVDGDGGGVHA